jgi:hypothetical protein
MRCVPDVLNVKLNCFFLKKVKSNCWLIYECENGVFLCSRAEIVCRSYVFYLDLCENATINCG